MSVAARLLAFAALLAGVFALALFAGDRADLGRTEASDAGHGEPAAAGHGGGAPEADPVRGLAVSEGGLTLDLDRRAVPAGKPFALRFSVRDRRGQVVRDFDREHAKRMHLIVARRDLTGFQHLHPRQARDGSWSVSARLAEPGTYRVFADFARHGRPRTLGGDLAAGGAVRSRDLSAPAGAVTVDGMRVALDAGRPRAGTEAALAFRVTRRGKPVAVQPYLGARGHLVALREGDLAFLHVHPDRDRLRFRAEFPSAGRYRLFLQFKTGGQVHTAAFTQELAR